MEVQPVYPKGNQSWIFIGMTDAEAEAPILWPPDAKNWLIGKDCDAGKDWMQKEKGTTEEEMFGWHCWLNGCEFEQAPGIGEGQEAWRATVHGVTKSWTWLRLNWLHNSCMCPKLLQLCPAICDSMDWSPPGSSVQGILQARILEGLSCPPPGIIADSWIKPASLMSLALAGEFFTTRATWEAPAAKSLQSYSTLCDPIDGSPPGSPSLGFSRQEHWSGLPFPSPMHESEKWKGSCSVMSNS